MSNITRILALAEQFCQPPLTEIQEERLIKAIREKAFRSFAEFGTVVWPLIIDKEREMIINANGKLVKYFTGPGKKL